MQETLQALSVGRDPRVLPEYERLRNEINKLSHISRPEVDWGLVHQMAQAIFEKQGVDLQTALYFTLARARLHGLSGFTEGCEFLSNLIVTQWDNVWPPVHQARARVEMLEAQALNWPAAPDAARLSDVRLALGEQTLRDMEGQITRDYQAQMVHVQQLSPLWPYQYADGLRQALRMLYPQSLAVSAMDSQWQQMLAAQRGATPDVSSWPDASVKVDALLTELQTLERQNKTVTISYLKSALYDIRTEMERDTPFTVQLSRLEAQQRVNQTVNPAVLDNLQTTLKSYSVRLYQLQPVPGVQ